MNRRYVGFCFFLFGVQCFYSCKGQYSNIHSVKGIILIFFSYSLLKWSASRYGQHNCLQCGNYNLLRNTEGFLNNGFFFFMLKHQWLACYTKLYTCQVPTKLKILVVVSSSFKYCLRSRSYHLSYNSILYLPCSCDLIT